MFKLIDPKLFNNSVLHVPQKYWAAQLFSKCSTAYYYDFWRSCDWSNDAENTDLITEINYYLTHSYIYNIAHFYRLYCIFYWTNAASVSRWDLFQKHFIKLLRRICFLGIEPMTLAQLKPNLTVWTICVLCIRQTLQHSVYASDQFMH